MYQAISNLSQGEREIKSLELAALAQIWLERKDSLKQNGAHQEFLKKLQREWAIETGIIERLYTWDRGVTEVLIEQGIDTAIISHRGGLGHKEAENVTRLIEDQMATVEGLFAFVKDQQPLSQFYIRQMQSQLTLHQDTTTGVDTQGNRFEVSLIKGKYKEQPNNPRRTDGSQYFYCPPERVVDEMQVMLEWYEQATDVAPEVLSAWLHHRFTQIHPFQDGNGRVARTLASLVFLKAGLFPVVIRDQDRLAYIEALEQADGGDLQPLTHLFSKRQKQALLKALGLEQQVTQAGQASAIISSALTVLKEKARVSNGQTESVYQQAGRLQQAADAYFNKVELELSQGLKDVTPLGAEAYHAGLQSAAYPSKQDSYFRQQIIEIANKFDYHVNFDVYRSWVRLSIHTAFNFEIVCSIHGYGHGKTGLMAATLFSALRVEKEGGGTEVAETRPACTDHFQFNYAEADESISTRFHDWLEHSLPIALAEWSSRLA